MKKKFTSLVVAFALLLGSAIPGFAASRLERPVIEDIDAGKNSIKIDWTYVKHSDGYHVYRSTSKDGTYNYIDTVHESWYRDYDIIKGTRYYYKVRAISYDGYEYSKLSKWRSAKVNKPSASSGSSYTVTQTVYITNTGSKYHRYGCRYLHSSCIPIDLSSARSYGYGACSVCW